MLILAKLAQARSALAGRALSGLLLVVTPVGAECLSTAPWDRIPDSARNFVTPLPLSLVGGAALAPVLMVPTAADHELRLLAQDDLGGRHDLEPVSVAVPYVAVGGLMVGYAASAIWEHCEAQRVQAAMLQSAVFTTAVVITLKWSTGRQWPAADRDPTDPESLRADTSTRFDPFGRVFTAFPSGHTAIAFALASSLQASLPDGPWYRWVGYPIATFVSAGMWLGDHHWASDIVSGGLMGEAIGRSVGRSFAGHGEEGLAIVPLERGVGVVWSDTW